MKKHSLKYTGWGRLKKKKVSPKYREAWEENKFKTRKEKELKTMFPKQTKFLMVG